MNDYLMLLTVETSGYEKTTTHYVKDCPTEDHAFWMAVWAESHSVNSLEIDIRFGRLYVEDEIFTYSLRSSQLLGENDHCDALDYVKYAESKLKELSSVYDEIAKELTE